MSLRGVSRHHRAFLELAVVLLLSCAGVLAAQGPPPDTSPSPVAGPSAQNAKPETKEPLKPFQFSAELRLRPEIRDNADLKPADDFDAFTGLRLRLDMRIRPHRRFRIFLQAQEVEVFDSNSDKVIHDLSTNLHQGYFEWQVDARERWTFSGGRQEFIYGEERLVGAFGWDNVGRSFDAARLRNRTGAWTNDFFWGRQVDVRRNGAPARAGEQDLSGAYSTRVQRGSPARIEVYGLFLRDSLLSHGEIATNPLETTRIFTIGARGVYQPKTGWRYSLESALQFGKRGPDDHLAAMFIGTGGYAWAGRYKPRVQFEYDFGSGDNHPTDGSSHEFHNLFPTNHPYYGYMDLMGLRNMHDFRATLATNPHPKLTLDADYHRFLLAEPRGPWKNAVGRVLGSDPTGASGRDVGQEVDFTARVPLMTRIQLMGGYSFFLPGTFAERTRGPETQQWGYVQITARLP